MEVGLKSRYNGLSGPNRAGAHARRPAIAGAFTTLLFVMGECALLEQGWEGRRSDLAKNIAKTGAERLGGFI